jgi:hypothetical protein
VTSQQKEALIWGNEVRVYRARVKKGIEATDLRFEDVLASGDVRLARMKVIDLLRHIPGIRATRATTWLRSARIFNANVTVEKMTAAQRSLLLLTVNEYERTNPTYARAKRKRDVERTLEQVAA